MGHINSALAAARRAWAYALVYATDTINIVRYAYLFTYIVVGLVGSCVAGYFGFYTLAPALAWLAFVICAILSYAFGARLILGTTGFKMFRRILRMLGDSDEAVEQPNLLNVWYWQAFIAMWASIPLVALAILRPWEAGRTLQLIAAVFMILYVVAAQRGDGKTSGRIYAGLAVAVMAAVIFAVVNPGDWARLSGSHQRGQNQTSIDEGYQATLASKLLPQLQSVSNELAQLQYDENQQIAAGKTLSAVQQARKQNLVAARENIKTEIDTLTSTSNPISTNSWLEGIRSLDPYLLLILVGGILLTMFAVSKAVSKTSTAGHS